nr:unnamed protein product [Digitaria exilis]
MRSRVRVLNVAHVLPASPDQAATAAALPDDGGHDVKLSFMDAMFVNRVPMQRLFFYEGPNVPPFPSLVRSLKSSLAAALAVFHPLAGKLTHLASTTGDDDVFVDCAPAAVSPGVTFVEAEFAGTIDDMRRLAAGDEHHTETLMLLGPSLNAGRLPAPVLAVQVTRSVWQFMSAWSSMSRSPEASSSLTPPTFDRTAIRYPKSDEVARKFLRTVAPALPVARSPAMYTPPNQRRRTFLLRAGDIAFVEELILAQSKSINMEIATRHPSTYVAVSSLVWTSIVRAKSSPSELNLDPAAAGDDDAYFLVPVDLRRHLGSTIDERYFGNCVAPCYAVAAIGDLRDDGAGLARAAAAIVAGVRAGVRDDDPLGGAERWVERFMAVPKERLTHTGSSNRFMAYEVDFGWGRPSRVEELMSLFVRELVLLLGAGDGCVQVTVAMDHKIMEGFEANLFRVSSV